MDEVYKYTAWDASGRNALQTKFPIKANRLVDVSADDGIRGAPVGEQYGRSPNLSPQSGVAPEPALRDKT